MHPLPQYVGGVFAQEGVHHGGIVRVAPVHHGLGLRIQAIAVLREGRGPMVLDEDVRAQQVPEAQFRCLSRKVHLFAIAARETTFVKQTDLVQAITADVHAETHGRGQFH